MKTFREYLEEINAKPPGAPAGTQAASNKTNVANTGGATPGAQAKPSSNLQGVTNVVPAQSNSPTQGSQGTVAPTDMEEPEAVVNVKSGQNAGQTSLKDFKATVTPGEAEIEFKSPDGKTFKVPQEFFIDEQIKGLKKLSGIQK
jgi:hypothetical protein